MTSHDVSAIGGNASLLLMDEQLHSAETLDCVQQIFQAAERASGLTRQLLTFSRKQAIQPVQLDLNEVVAQMTKMLQRILGEDISLTYNYEAGLPAIQADANMIEQVLLNLAVNSRDAMPNGGKLTITTAPKCRARKSPEKILATRVDSMFASRWRIPDAALP